jgi:uncharacterized protein (TIGR03000 family)
MFRSALSVVRAAVVAAALTALAATPAAARPVHAGGGYHGGGVYHSGGSSHGGGYYGGYHHGYYPGSYGYGYRPYSYGDAYTRPYYSPWYGGVNVYNSSPTYVPEVYSFDIPVPSTTQSFYGPSDTQVTPSTDVARVQVHVGDPNAELWFNDTPMRQRGEWRSFETPTLTLGRDYTYDARVRWTDPVSGATKEETRKITVHAGERLTVDFTRPAS